MGYARHSLQCRLYNVAVNFQSDYSIRIGGFLIQGFWERVTLRVSSLCQDVQLHVDVPDISLKDETTSWLLEE